MTTNVYYLTNGLPVIYIVEPSAPLAYACLCVNAGAKDDRPSLFGMAHAVEHFLFLGSEHYSKQELNTIPSQLGSELIGATDIDFTSFGFRVLQEHFADMLKLLADMVIYPQFPSDKIPAELEIIKTEMSSHEDDDEDRRMGYNLHSCFGVPKRKAYVLGTEKTLSRISVGKAKAFWEEYYVASNSALCVYVNDYSYWKLIEACFGKMRSGVRPSMPVTPFHGRSYKTSGYGSEVEISLIFDAQLKFSGTEDRLHLMATELLANALGGNFSSRLYQVLRHEKSLIYGISTNLDCYTYGNIFHILTYCLPKNVEDVIANLCEEIRKVRLFGIRDEELVYAKNTLTTDLLATMMNPEDLVFDSTEYFLLGRFIPLEQQLVLLETVTTSDILESAQRILSNAPTFGVIGGTKEIPSYDSILAMLDIKKSPSS
ncbi:MAG: insulinase family protein [Alphaproteobacteria bacterium]|nr:insulinase family protein [Alphaproteobacteria bacterium]